MGTTRYIYLVDSNQNNLDMLKYWLTKFGINISGTSTSKEEALLGILKYPTDVLITDVNINEKCDGIKLVEELKIHKTKLQVIFLTNETDKVIIQLAKKVEPATYLIKPLNIFNILISIEAAKKKIKSDVTEISRRTFEPKSYVEETLYIKKMQKIIKVPVNSIQYIEVGSNYSTLDTNIGKFTLKLSLKNLMQKLPDRKFIRIHRNYLVNNSQIIEYDFGEYTAKLSNKHLPIGRFYKNNIKANLSPLS